MSFWWPLGLTILTVTFWIKSWTEFDLEAHLLVYILATFTSGIWLAWFLG